MIWGKFEPVVSKIYYKKSGCDPPRRLTAQGNAHQAEYFGQVAILFQVVVELLLMF